jgi:hypothetical protein
MKTGWSAQLVITVLFAAAACQAIWATRAWADVPDEPFIEFSVSPSTIRLGECTTLHWHTANVQAVYFNGQGVSGINQNRIECPRQTTTYTLLVVRSDGLQDTRTVTVNIEGSVVDPGSVAFGIQFTADRFETRPGECVNIYWNVINVRAVYYNNRGVAGENQTRSECPRETNTYTLRVVKLDTTEETRTIQIGVSGGRTPRYDLDMDDGQQVDFDRDGRVSEDEDDFAWFWQGGEEGEFAKSRPHPDLKLTVLGKGSTDDLDRLTRSICRDHLGGHDDSQVTLSESSIACFRSDDDNYGKLRVDDIRSTNGRLQLQWYLWD